MFPARRSLPVLAALGLLACGGDSSGIDTHVEDLVTIGHGIYGQATASNDVGEPTVEYLPGLEVQVYPRPLSGTLGTAVASTTSAADRGFYQVELAAGDYVVCTSFHRCVALSLAEGDRLRLDYEMGVGPGWSGPGITMWPQMP